MVSPSVGVWKVGFVNYVGVGDCFSGSPEFILQLVFPAHGFTLEQRQRQFAVKMFR